MNPGQDSSPGQSGADIKPKMSQKNSGFVACLPNIITLSRVPVLFIIAGLLVLAIPSPVSDALAVPASGDPVGLHWTATAAFVLFVIAAISDWFDGWVARRYNVVSNFGKLMDALTDKILNTGMFIVLQAFGAFPRWCTFLVLLILMRELFITGLRLVAAGKGVILAAERSGKIKTLLQVISISILLGVLAERHDDWGVPTVVETVFEHAGFACFYVATFLTISSGVGYLVKYWDVFMGEPESR